MSSTQVLEVAQVERVPAALEAAPRDLAGAVAACRAVTRKHARTFSFAAPLMPRELRAAAYALYAFCRRADDAVDCARDERAALLALGEAAARLDRACGPEGLADADPELVALAWAVRRFGIPRAALDELLEGMELDLRPLRLRSWSELHRYCVLAAGTVGRALAPALGAAPAAWDAAEALGVAMQLTNILRDVDEDLGRGRIYLAADELARHGLCHADLEELHLARTSRAAATPRLDELRGKLRGFVAAEIGRARSWYARGAQGIPAIASFRARLCVRTMAVLYGEILTRLEGQALDPFAGRARVPLWRKLWLLVACLGGRAVPTGARALPASVQAG